MVNEVKASEYPIPIKVMADYDCPPLWWDSKHPAWQAHKELGDITPPLSLGITKELAGDLRQWAEIFDAWLNRDDPASTYVPPEEEEAFNARGASIGTALGG